MNHLANDLSSMAGMIEGITCATKLKVGARSPTKQSPRIVIRGLCFGRDRFDLAKLFLHFVLSVDDVFVLLLLVFGGAAIILRFGCRTGARRAAGCSASAGLRALLLVHLLGQLVAD